MIDTEPKVLKAYEQKTPKWLDLDNIKYFEHGRGNNWSYGYLHETPPKKVNESILSEYRQFSHKKENELIKVYVEENRRISEYVLEKVRKQLETVDCALAINVISSLGGGTGSGLGTKTIQRLSEQFNIDIFAHTVLPNMSGQTPLQVYNCLLSLNVIQQYSSAIFPIQNQKYLQHFRLNNTEYFNTQSLDSINEEIAKNLSKLIKINDMQGFDRFYNDIALSHVLSNELKYLNLMSSESSEEVDAWQQTFQGLIEKIKVFNLDFSQKQQHLRRQSLLSGEILTFGAETVDYDKLYRKKLQSSLNPHYTASLQFSQVDCKGTQISSLIQEQTQKTKKQKKSKAKNQHQALLIMNHSNIVRYLSYLCQQGKLKFDNKAYLWHYEYVDIEQALQKIQQTIDQYNLFTHNKI